jgi:acyl carrier protein
MELVTGLLSAEVAQILRLPPEKLDVNRSVLDLGMDSLMGVELVLSVEERFGVSLPVMVMSEGPTIARIAERIVKQLLGSEEVAATGSGQVRGAVETVVARHAEEVDEEELEALTEELAGSADSGTKLVP